MNGPIYLDNLATTQMDLRVAEAMKPWLDQRFGNASSSTHVYGWHAHDDVDFARDQVAELIGATTPNEITFTSGATESNNTVIAGVARRFGPGTHIVTTAIEHPSVIAPSRAVQDQGVDVTFVEPGRDGLISVDRITAALRPETRLVSVMTANNEVGTVQPIADIAAAAAARGVLMHTDATQAVGKVAFDVQDLAVDFVSLSAHKMYGPQGIGALYVRRGAIEPGLPPLLLGGGQEGGRRAGTSPVAAIVGFGTACDLARREFREEAIRVTELRDQLWGQLTESLRGVELNGSEHSRLPGCLNFSIDGVIAEALISSVPELALSVGSACSSGNSTGSHVLSAMGIDPNRQRNTLRIGLGRFTTDVEIETTARFIVAACRVLRSQGDQLATAS